MSDQLHLPGLAERDEGIGRAGEAARQDWWDAALAAVRLLARRHGAFTADDVWEELDALPVDPPQEPRALGAVFQAARREGLIVPTARFVPSRRPVAHRKPCRVWEVAR